jgi:hypothetical protein
MGTPSIAKMMSSLRNTSCALCSGMVRVTRTPPSYWLASHVKKQATRNLQV